MRLRMEFPWDQQIYNWNFWNQLIFSQPPIPKTNPKKITPKLLTSQWLNHPSDFFRQIRLSSQVEKRTWYIWNHQPDTVFQLSIAGIFPSRIYAYFFLNGDIVLSHNWVMCWLQDWQLWNVLSIVKNDWYRTHFPSWLHFPRHCPSKQQDFLTWIPSQQFVGTRNFRVNVVKPC